MKQPLLREQGPVTAYWNDGASAASHPVALFHNPISGAILLCPQNSRSGTRPLAVWKTADIRALPRTGQPGGAPLRLAVHPDAGQRLLVPEAAGREVLEWLSGSLTARRRVRLRRWLLGGIGVWILAVGLYFSSSLIFSLAAAIIPQSWEERLGRSSLDSVLAALRLLPEVRGVNEQAGRDPGLRALMERLEAGAPTKGYSFTLQVLDADLVNAFALPGGYMLVTTGLIKECRSPGELAGVLGHEMAHITTRHGTSGMLRDQTWSFVLRVWTGGDGVASALAGKLLVSSFSRADERQADRLGVERLIGARIDPAGLADFFQRLQAEETRRGGRGGLPGYFASHPASQERRQNILAQREAMLSGDPAPFLPAMSKSEWRQLRAACGIPDQPADREPEAVPEPLPQPGQEPDQSNRLRYRPVNIPVPSGQILDGPGRMPGPSGHASGRPEPRGLIKDACISLFPVIGRVHEGRVHGAVPTGPPCAA